MSAHRIDGHDPRLLAAILGLLLVTLVLGAGKLLPAGDPRLSAAAAPEAEPLTGLAGEAPAAAALPGATRAGLAGLSSLLGDGRPAPTPPAGLAKVGDATTE